MRRAAKRDAVEPAIRRHKYGAVRTEVDGIVFASKREARRYQELKLMERAGEIRRLLLQPRYGLYIQPFLAKAIDRVKVGDYVGDFQYEDKQLGWQKVIEDVKGVKTPLYRLKKKIVQALYGITVREV